MSITIFNTPILSPLLRYISLISMKLLGWKHEGEFPPVSKAVMIAAPHTTNWDLIIMLALCFIFRVKIVWLGKDKIFRFPFGWFMRWMGGVSIDRSKSNNVVSQSIEQFNRSESLVMTVPPEGTRKKVKVWKTGFYYIALGAKVPIVLGFIDFERKTGGILGTFTPTGDIEKDMVAIQGYYVNIKGKFADKTSLPEFENNPPQ
ncbi:MAG: lysophospholipid acyltransferase family protein [SAR324 cluster bacterium]|nr:lysophospholipid acyltransferase family protein [SAR324 cluster bacterium]MBF0352770.1 lysophospholipid acyltransferase family protein [SAR324 cluster bacterium]